MSEHDNSPVDGSIDWEARQHNAVKRFLNGLERVTLLLERPANRLVREPQFNPLYHTGIITVFLLILVAVTGVYLIMFFQFGFEASYQAVARVEISPIGRIMRALHRYASDLAMLAALLHGYRTFFMDRFRGPRWLAWVTGVVSAAMIWIIGVTGYWLPVDERAQLLMQSLIRVVEGWALGARFLLDNLLSDAAGAGWVPIMLVLIVHIGLSAAVGAFFVIHIRRLSRPKLVPPRFLIGLVAGIVVLASIVAPVGMLAKASLLRLPGPVDIDLFYLFYLPVALHWPALRLWGGVAIQGVLATVIPWLLIRKPLSPISIDAARCIGCTLCAADCPYRALVMAPREDDSGRKLIAVVNPKLCVSCGVCIGSCSFMAMTLGDHPAEPLWEDTAARAAEGSRVAGGQPVKVVFTCERHAVQRARGYVREIYPHSSPLPAQERVSASSLSPQARGTEGEGNLVVIPVTCIAMAHPDLAAKALAAGAGEAQFIGCPPEDCANREGNVFTQQRLERKRLPRAGHELDGAALTSDWLPPDDFRRALAAKTHQTAATAYDLVVSRDNWRRLLPVGALLAVVMVATVLLSRVPYAAYVGD